MSNWIKMQVNLWDNPRISQMADLLDTTEAEVIGALFRVWTIADQHTEDGVLNGMTHRSIDRKTGVNGFASALAEIGWLTGQDGLLTLVNYNEHNGETAKKRAQTARRVAKSKALTKAVTPKRNPPKETGNAVNVTTALPKEEKSRVEKKSKNPLTPKGGISLPHSDKFKASWQEWETYRKERRKTVTPSTAKKQIEALAALTEDEAIETINLSIKNGWTGLFPNKPNDEAASQHPPQEPGKFGQREATIVNVSDLPQTDAPPEDNLF